MLIIIIICLTLFQRIQAQKYYYEKSNTPNLTSLLILCAHALVCQSLGLLCLAVSWARSFHSSLAHPRTQVDKENKTRKPISVSNSCKQVAWRF